MAFYAGFIYILKVRQQEILLFEATHLVLNTGLNGWELPGIALLLRACRKLENLVIVMNDEAEELQVSLLIFYLNTLPVYFSNLRLSIVSSMMLSNEFMLLNKNFTGRTKVLPPLSACNNWLLLSSGSLMEISFFE